MSYKPARPSEVEQVALARRAIARTDPNADGEELLRLASQKLHDVLSTGETPDFTREALIVIIVQCLMNKYEGSKGDLALARTVSRYVGHERLKCDRNKIYRLRHKYQLQPRQTPTSAALLMSEMDLPGSGRIRSPRPDNATQILDDPFYAKRPADLVLEALAPEFGETIIIKAPRGFGATRLIERYTALCQRHGKRVGVLDLSFAHPFVPASGDPADEASSYIDVLGAFAQLMRRKFGLSPTDDEPIASQLDMTHFVEDRILAELNGPCTLVMERTDRFLTLPFKDDFFSMVRYWHNSRSAPDSPWRRVDLVLATSVDPMRFISDHTRSPFAVGRTLTLGLFDRSACQTLDAQTGTGLSDEELDLLYELTHGQPYLLWRAFKELRLGLSFDSLIRTAADREGPFREHLLQVEHALEHRHELADTYRDLVVSERAPDEDDARALLEAGLARVENDTLVPLCPIYVSYFRDRLA